MSKPQTLKQAREARGLTQEQLEAASLVTQGTISLIETGSVKNPSWSTVRALAAALDVDPRELRFGGAR
jgi:transcriptional regulator with XRE-family HTH domain